MKLYYTAYTDTVVEEWYCDALTFRVKDETLYSMDIAGGNTNFTVKSKMESSHLSAG